MELYNTRRNRGKLNYVWVFLALMLSGHALFASSDPIHDILFYGMLFGGFLVLITRKFPRYIPRGINPATISLIWLMCIMINFIANMDAEPLMGYVSNCLLILLAYVYTVSIDSQDFLKKYVQIMFFLSLLSLIMFYFVQKLPVYDFMPIVRGPGLSGEYDKYQGFLLYYKADLARNNGMFWEPGIFASNLIMAIIFLPSLDIRKKWKYYVVFYIALISTKSSAGYVLLIFVTLYLLAFQVKEIKDHKSRAIFFGLIMILLVLFMFAYLNLESVFSFFGLNNVPVFQKILNIEDSSRANAIQWNLNAFLSSPLFGHGYNGLGALPLYGKQFTGTATSFRLLAVFGITGLFYSYFLVRGWLRQKQIFWLSRIILVAIILLIVNKEGQDQFLLMWILIMYANQDKPLLRDPKGELHAENG